MHECDKEQVDRSAAGGRLVRDVMISRPKTLPGTATIADVRRLFENPSVQTALLADGTALVGAIERDRVPPQAADDEAAAGYADSRLATIDPDAPVEEALASMDAAGTRRLVVVDGDGLTLRGLVALTGDRGAFCSG